jgi:hypothetical protein
VELRHVAPEDWPQIARVANEALPNATDGNRAWLENRRAFAGQRFQYVAEDHGSVIGYGAVEQDADNRARWRLFVVMSPLWLNAAVGEKMFLRLQDDARAAGARILWMREEASDEAIAEFAERHGLTEKQRYVVEGLPVVVYERALSAPLARGALPGRG